MLLALTFINGIGLAMRWPVFAAIVPHIVGKQRTAAGAGAQRHCDEPVARGRPGGGRCHAGGLQPRRRCSCSTRCWRDGLRADPALEKREPRTSALPGERFLGAMRVGISTPCSRRACAWCCCASSCSSCRSRPDGAVAAGGACTARRWPGHLHADAVVRGLGRHRGGAAVSALAPALHAQPVRAIGTWCMRRCQCGGLVPRSGWRCRPWWWWAWPGSRWPTR
jgi:hypothetical protein